MSAETRARARALLAEALEIAAASLADDAALATHEAWDSLAHMRLIEALEAELGGALDAQTILAVESLDDVAALLERNAQG